MPGLDALPPFLRGQRAVRTLEASMAGGRMAHGILLKGDDLGVLEQVALALAGQLLRADGAVQRHPDLFTLRPAKKSRTITVGERDGEESNSMRALIRNLQQTSNQGGYKVALIYEADRMNSSAANAFLKTLEEPPRQTLMLLLSVRPYDLLPTIRSRCFQFRISGFLDAQPIDGWDGWLEDYRGWIRWLHTRADEARSQPERAILQAYGLIARFSAILEHAMEEDWTAREAKLPELLKDDEVDALRVGLSKGLRDRLLRDIEEATRLAALELSHVAPFPAQQLARVIAALEAVPGWLVLNMKDETALEGFFLSSLRLWTAQAG